MPEGLPAGSAVDLCGLEHILRDGLQTRDIDDHHIADLLPAHQYDEAPEAVFCFEHHSGIKVAEDAVEDHEPDIAQDDAADQVRHKEDRPEDIRALDALRQDIGDGECQHIDDEQRHKREQRRVPERVQEAIVLENGLVVLQAHPSPFAGCLELAERQKQALGKRIQEAHAERSERRQQEQPAPALDRPADQAT